MKNNILRNITLSLLTAGSLALSTGCSHGPDYVEGIVQKIDYASKKDANDTQLNTDIDVNTATGGGFLSGGGNVHTNGLNVEPVYIIMNVIGPYEISPQEFGQRVLYFDGRLNTRDTYSLDRVNPSVLLGYISVGDTIKVDRWKYTIGNKYDTIDLYGLSEIQKE